MGAQAEVIGSQALWRQLSGSLKATHLIAFIVRILSARPSMLRKTIVALAVVLASASEDSLRRSPPPACGSHTSWACTDPKSITSCLVEGGGSQQKSACACQKFCCSDQFHAAGGIVWHFGLQWCSCKLKAKSKSRTGKGSIGLGGSCPAAAQPTTPPSASANVSSEDAVDYVNGGTLKLSWSDCGDSSFHAKVTSLSPSSLTIGQKTHVIGQGHVDESVTGGPLLSLPRQAPPLSTSLEIFVSPRPSICHLG